MVEIAEAQKWLDVFDLIGFWPVYNSADCVE